MRKTPAASIRWLSLADLKASHLATSALDAAEPIVMSGLSGLNGRAFEGGPAPADLVQARVAGLLTGRGGRIDVAFSYRRGGGAVEAEMIERDSGTQQAADPPAPDWSLTLSATGAEPLRLTAARTTHPARALLRARQPRQARRRTGPRRPGGRGGSGASGGDRHCRNGRREDADRGSLSLSGATPPPQGRPPGRMQRDPSRAQRNPSRTQ